MAYQNFSTRKTDTLQVNSYVEGPHIKYITHKKIEVSYIEHDSLNKTTNIIKRYFKFKTDSLSFKGFVKTDSSSYLIYRKIKPPSGIIETKAKIAVFGDIHGEFKSLQAMLKYNKIIDENDKWIWGKGHVVFTGDIFDRGNMVTECLWLIYKLEQQAKKAGGDVHFLLGNHEVMILLNDMRYVAKKYLNAAKACGTTYSHFYKQRSVIGRWLRSKNTLIRINKILFVHAGLSPKFMKQKYSIDEVNTKMRHFINDYAQLDNIDFIDLFLYSESPIWYRGYLLKTEKYDKINLQEILKTLDFYKSIVIIFGHTPVARVYPTFSFKLIAMDVHIGDPRFLDQGLLIDNNMYYRIFAHKQKERLK